VAREYGFKFALPSDEGSGRDFHASLRRCDPDQVRRVTCNVSGSQSVLEQTPLAWSTLNKGMLASQIQSGFLVRHCFRVMMHSSNWRIDSGRSGRTDDGLSHSNSNSHLDRHAGVADDFLHRRDIAGMAMLEQVGVFGAERISRVKHHGGGQDAAHGDIFFFNDFDKAGRI